MLCKEFVDRQRDGLHARQRTFAKLNDQVSNELPNVLCSIALIYDSIDGLWVIDRGWHDIDICCIEQIDLCSILGKSGGHV